VIAAVTTRTARTWALLAGLGAVVAASLDASTGAYALAGVVCIACAVFLVYLDSLRRRGGTRR
jgi:hypothetical protein